MRSTFSRSKTQLVVYRTKQLIPRTKDEEDVAARQQNIPGFTQDALTNAKVFVIGVGGIGTHVAHALVRKGVGSLQLLDHDIVEPSNLPRQLYYPHDLYKPKAHRLARTLATEGFMATAIAGYNLSFQEAISRDVDLTGSLAIVCVDSNLARCAASRYYRAHHLPVIFCAVSEEANHGYVFVQEPDAEAACFACLYPDSVNDKTSPCPGTPAIVDVLIVVAGIAVYAVDTLLMPRARHWNYKTVVLSSGGDCTWTIARRPDCKLCGLSQNEPQIEGRP